MLPLAIGCHGICFFVCFFVCLFILGSVCLRGQSEAVLHDKLILFGGAKADQQQMPQKEPNTKDSGEKVDI